MEEAAVMMVGLNPERIMQGLKQLEYQHSGNRPNFGSSSLVLGSSSLAPGSSSHQSPATNFRLVGDYSMPNVSDKVVRIIISYADYIKRIVWSEQK
jgi:UDP-N-acetylglucosamine 2-epimerase (non-hydrolysing)